jgi:hypothetical protein
VALKDKHPLGADDVAANLIALADHFVAARMARRRRRLP